MGNAKTNLEYLKTTKSLIKQAIIDKGVEVSDTDTFRSYKDKIAGISGGGSLHNCTLEGTPYNFNGYIGNFSSTNYISLSDITNSEEVIFRIKYAVTGISSDVENLIEAQNVINLQLRDGIIQSWSWAKQTSAQCYYSISIGDILYFSILLTDQDTTSNTCTRKIYCSKTGFSTSSSDLLLTIDNDVITTATDVVMGSRASTEPTYNCAGFIDLSETCVIKPDGTYITRYYY